MNKHELWAAYVAKNPHWLTENVTLTPKGIKDLVESTFDVGESEGSEKFLKAFDQSMPGRNRDHCTKGKHGNTDPYGNKYGDFW